MLKQSRHNSTVTGVQENQTIFFFQRIAHFSSASIFLKTFKLEPDSIPKSFFSVD